MQHLKHFIQQMPIAVAMLDRQLRYIAVTDKWLQIHKLEGKNVIGKHYEEVFATPSSCLKQLYMRCLADGTSEEYHGKIIPRADGATACMRYQVNPWRDNEGNIGGLITLTDSTFVRTQTQDALQTTIEALRASNRDLQQYAHICAHDLKEPLRNIASFAQLLAKDGHSQLNVNSLKYLDFIAKGVERMHEMIKDILNSAMIEGREKAFMPIDMNALMREVSENFATQIIQTQAKIECDPLPVVLGNRTQLLQLMQNLISNAIKYSGDNPPHITIQCQETEGAWQFSIQDRGMGMDADLLDQVSEIFQKINNSYAFTGKGIGLTVCKKVVDIHHGKISVESTPGQGTIFRFTLPKNPRVAG
jgi:PAS domain S-box-containing protein